MGGRLINLQLSILLYGIKDIIKKSDLNINNDDDIIKYLIENDIIYKENKDIIEVLKYDTAELLQKDIMGSESLSYIAYEANNIASGIEQKNNNDLPLNSIFNRLRIEINSKEKQFQIGEFSQDKFNMPKENVKQLEIQDYTNIFKNILKRLEKLKKSITPEKLLNILEETCVYFPANAYIEYPDISYYDHSKITSAIASSMYIYDKENKITDFKKEYLNKENRIKEKFILVSGEFSGIQNFIYTISSKMAMKSLRGRSFYLELFIEHIIDEILSNLELSRINLIYSGGSQFYLLLPNIDKAKEIVIGYKEIINDFLLEKIGTTVYFEMSYTHTSAEELGNGLNSSDKKYNKIGDIFKRMSADKSKGKLSRYSKEQLKKLLDENSNINRISSYTKECIICKKAEDESILKKNANAYDSIELCDSCKNYIELGKSISKLYKDKNEQFIVEENCDKNNSGLILPKYPNGFVQIKSYNHIDKNIHRYYSINSYNFSDELCKNIWVGNYNINDDKDNKLIEFKNLVKKSKGIQRLAVLRADVDNLGTLFQSGFEDKNSSNPYKYVTIAKSAVLSRYLSDFFKRKINIILEKKVSIVQSNGLFENYCNIIKSNNISSRNIVIVYSGGDDVFVIGTWDDIIEFSVDLRTAFNEFTNGKVTLSAGIGFFSENFPVYQMANITGELEHIAKTYIKSGENTIKKDSVALFGQMNDKRLNHIYRWDDFINKVLYEKYIYIKNRVKFQEDGEQNKVFVGKSKWYKILDLLSNILCSEDNRLDIARFAYILARIKSTKENNDNYEQLKTQLLQWMNTKDNKENVRQLFTAINILIYEERESQGE